jgi:glutamate formiminotransferase / 5-formyltetrahydrofolate cyclo-ligase
MRQVIQSAVNFSEGRRPEVVAAIVDAARQASEVMVADYSADVDHNRMVVTFLGGPEDIRQAVFASAKVAVELIDLRLQKGAHPRIGAVDVVPLVPIQGITMDECVELSRLIGADFADKLGVPVCFYERSALSDRRRLPEIRRGGFEALCGCDLTGERKPDLGPCRVHPAAGITVIGARGPLVAYNIDLETQDMEIARAIVRKIRSGEAGLAGVKSMAVWLAAQSRAQVSMNLTQPDVTPVCPVYEFVQSEARELGVEIAESEFIGLVSQRYLGSMSRDDLKAWHLKDTQILEHWVDNLG